MVAVLATIGIVYRNTLQDVPPLVLTPPTHLDGQGPLGSVDDPTAWQGYGFDPKVGGPGRTVGVHLCLAEGTVPAILDGSVTPVKTVGGGLTYLGSYVRQFRPIDGDRPIGGLSGFPPYASEKLNPMRGFAVEYPCQRSDPDPTVPYTELLLGVGPGVGTDGGGWMGIDVGYSILGQHHIVTLAYYVFICGPAVPSKYC